MRDDNAKASSTKQLFFRNGVWDFVLLQLHSRDPVEESRQMEMGMGMGFDWELNEKWKIEEKENTEISKFIIFITKLSQKLIEELGEVGPLDGWTPIDSHPWCTTENVSSTMHERIIILF
jgi:hypothetical protein